MLSLAAVFVLFMADPQHERVLVFEESDVEECEVSRVPCTLGDVEALRLCPGKPVWFSSRSRLHAELIGIRRDFVPKLIHYADRM